jgi:signal transduction histidine kinase
MLFRRQTIHARLVTSFAGVVSALLAIALIAALFWLVTYQRETLRDRLQSYAAIVATASSPALRQKNVGQLDTNLTVLAADRNVQWVAIIQNSAILAEVGQIPPELRSSLTDLKAVQELTNQSGNIVMALAAPSTPAESAWVVIGAAMSGIRVQFAAIAFAGALLLLALFLVALPVFHRLVRTVSDPLQKLARMSQLKSSFGSGDTEAATRVGAGDTPLLADQAPAEVERLGVSFDRMLSGIAERDAQMRQSRDELRALNASLQAVREKERTRIAHEIHDELGQRLTAIKLAVARVTPPTSPDGAEVAKMIDETVKVVREISWELRPSVLDALGLTAAIEWLGEDFQRRMATRCKVQVPDPSPYIDEEVATQVFRICQELLTNIARHAGASRVVINLSVDDSLRLDVSDDGVGIKPRGLEQRSLGLLGIRERVHGLGGKLRIETVPQIAGTRVYVTIPLDLALAKRAAGVQP